MGISGRHVETFSEANLASCTGINLDAGYHHVFFDVVSVDSDSVKLKSHWDGSLFEFPIIKGKEWCEYAEITQQCALGAVIRMKPSKIKIAPFKGERF